ncbi:S8 family serine peptidase [Bradyrhizobium sp. STM 3843]|uniref:S8 family serine peptidase n=1 Tax=Bradyrhizobium sp. STM 3843 TaxID=551947 RepID=UPI001FCADA2F|nr:S8 family serine peptidase [Bradyrhizobium sp. STM 3843]
MGGSAHAQAMLRSPSINIQSRVPSINPNIGERTPTPHLTGTMAVRPVLPNVRYSPNLSSTCSAANRDADGACIDKSASTADGGKGGGKGKISKSAQRRRDNAAPAGAADLNTFPGEIVAEIDGALSAQQADDLARRHRLRRLDSSEFPLIGATIGLFRITDRRSVEAASRDLAADASVRGVQPNYRYRLQDQKPPSAEGDPAQYALAKLRLPEAHSVAQGANVTIAVIDSGVDLRHPEFIDAALDAFDALGSQEGPHVHGTGIVGAIVSHARLMGSAPFARVLAIRAFGVSAKAGGKGPESSSYVILKALDYAAMHGAQIVNMSFAGPQDPLIERAIAAVAAKDVVLVAAAGNAGAKSPPLYPAANPNVIAVSATDAKDQLLPASNRGTYIAIAAPGADIFLPAPDGKYQITSGTSFSAAYVTGVVALILERNAVLKPERVRAVLAATARDLGTPGRDDLFGAGEADAYAAVQAAGPEQPAAMSATPSEPKPDDATDSVQTRDLRAPPPVSAMATGMATEPSPGRCCGSPGPAIGRGRPGQRFREWPKNPPHRLNVHQIDGDK